MGLRNAANSQQLKEVLVTESNAQYLYEVFYL